MSHKTYYSPAYTHKLLLQDKLLVMVSLMINSKRLLHSAPANNSHPAVSCCWGAISWPTWLDGSYLVMMLSTIPFKTHHTARTWNFNTYQYISWHTTEIKPARKESFRWLSVATNMSTVLTLFKQCFRNWICFLNRSKIWQFATQLNLIERSGLKYETRDSRSEELKLDSFCHWSTVPFLPYTWQWKQIHFWKYVYKDLRWWAVPKVMVIFTVQRTLYSKMSDGEANAT